MGSREMALHKILVVASAVLGGCFCQQGPERVTPVPILRFLDTQNEDGSYTYGFEAGDGTYKIETRHQNGQVQGKYGYYDPDGVLRETVYGADPDQGTQIDEVPAPFDKDLRGSAGNPEVRRGRPVKIVNGRRAVLRKRLRSRPQSTPIINQADSLNHRKTNIEPSITNQRERQGVRNRISQRQLQPIRNNRIGGLKQEETFRSRELRGSNDLSDPFITNLDLNTGSYTISY